MTDTLILKRVIAFIVTAAIVCGVFTAFVNINKVGTSTAFAADEAIIQLQINNTVMTVNNEELHIDEIGTTPLIVDGRTLVPIRAIIEAVGGEVSWKQESKETTLSYNGDVIRLVVDSNTAYLNDDEVTIDVAPTIINNRTMLPIRFIAESFSFNVEWDANTQTVTINTMGDEVMENTTDIAIETTNNEVNDENAPIVYMTNDISSEGLINVYNQLGFVPEGKVAIKLSTGEAGNTHYLDPNLIKDLVQSVDGTIVECNTAYGGARSTTAMHRQVAEDHGFTEIADVDIMDENGSMSIPIVGGDNLTENFVGANLANYDSMITLSHFKGHAMGGFGGAIKNMSIGIASSEGKVWIHTAGESKSGSIMSDNQDNFLESMAEATKGVVDYMEGKVVYVSVMNHLSVDCDCDGNPAEPEMHDVGILASTDPVALDQACIDIVYNTDRSESGALIERIESRNGLHTLEQAEKIGLGSRTYNLVNIDE